MLVLLGDLKESNPFNLTEDIVKTIDTLPEPTSSKESWLMQLRILIQLRKFESHLEVAMLKAATFFKEERDPFYKRGQAKERAKAYAEKLESARGLKKVGLLTDRQIAESLKLPLEVVEKL